jgi:hypothetical protein
MFDQSILGHYTSPDFSYPATSSGLIPPGGLVAAAVALIKVELPDLWEN